MRRFFGLIGIALLAAAPAVSAPAKVLAPNVRLSVQQRIFPPGKPAVVSLSTFNLRKAELAVYAVDIEALVPNAAALDARDAPRRPASPGGHGPAAVPPTPGGAAAALSVRDRLKALPLHALPEVASDATGVRTWTAVVKKPYPNSWMEQDVKLPKLPSGVYVVAARGGGVEARAWLAISNRALVLKRSPDVVKAWLVTALEGKPVPGAPLALYDAQGRVGVVKTGADGIATFAPPAGRGPLWVAARDSEPAFARANAPEAEKPYLVYVYTDRPVYRPGHLVRFRGTVRAIRRGSYSLPKAQKARVQIKTRGDTVVYDETLPLNEWGSFAGEFQLAPEPPLGTYSLEVALGDFREYAGFEVEAYRKPEFDVTVSTPPLSSPRPRGERGGEHALGGAPVPVTISAKYYFGSPVSGAKVTYRVSFQQYGRYVPERVLSAAGLGSAASARIEEGFSGHGRLDSDGKLALPIATRSVPCDRRLQVSAEVTDLSLRSRSAEAGMLLTAAQFRISASPGKERYQPGQRVEITASAQDYEDKPVQTPIRVTVIEHLADREGRAYQQRTDHTVRTGKDGRGTTTFRPVRPGRFEIEAWARDTEGNATFAESYFYVTKEKPEPEWPTLDASLDRDRYAPGETALLRVRTSLTGGSALLTVEGERIYRCEVQPLKAKEFGVKVPVLPGYQPGVSVRLTMVRRGEIVTTTGALNVPAAGKKLAVTLTPDKTAYQPGETATYAVGARDNRGQGVAAEIGLGVVDAALYAIRKDTTPSPFAVFWAPQADRVVTDFSLAATYPGGGYQRVPQATPPPAPKAGEQKAAARVRRLFVDTAYWGPSVVTDKEGNGRITFTIPDNLTTWRATGRGLTKATQAGDALVDVKVTMPLMVRLALPRFYCRGDEATAAALVHNYTGAERQVRVTLTAEGASVDGAAEQMVALPADGIRRLTWKVKVAGAAPESSADHVRFLVSADGGEGARDAMESTLPVFPDGVRRVDASAGAVTAPTAASDASPAGAVTAPAGAVTAPAGAVTAPAGMGDRSATIRMALPQGALPGQSRLGITLSPSLAGPLFEALDYLVGYPHGCAEQTMSRFLPDIIVARALKQRGVARKEPAMLQRFVSFGLQKLLRYQHRDGGWHWWEFDESDPFITAYVVYGLAMARDAGYPLAAGPLPRGVDYLRRELAREQDRTARCYLVWALAYARQWDEAGPKAAADAANELFSQRGKLDVFSRASLALALGQLSRQDKALAGLAEKGKTLAGELEDAAVRTGTAVHWTADASGSGWWLDSDVEVTAQVLQALLALKPDSPEVVAAVRWLMAAREGTHWTSTKDTASAVLALTAYLKRAKELAPDETVAVRVGERIVKTIRMGKEQVFANPVRVSIPAADLKQGENVVELEKAGTGNLYWSAQMSYVVPAEGAAPLSRGIELKRRYQVSAVDPVGAGDQPAGSLIGVSVDIVAGSNYRYCVLEEPVPAGCEIISGEEDRYPDIGCERREVWDDRLVFYFDYLPKGERTVTYWIRAEAPGAYRIRPGTASLMYFPEVRGEERLVRLRVTEE